MKTALHKLFTCQEPRTSLHDIFHDLIKPEHHLIPQRAAPLYGKHLQRMHSSMPLTSQLYLSLALLVCTVQKIRSSRVTQYEECLAQSKPGFSFRALSVTVT